MNQSESCGKVYLVGAGPGDPGLLTLKAKVLLENADIVLYDALVSPSILAMINPKAEQIHGGKRRGRHSLVQEEITALLIEKAQTNAVVVRLKGGDPFVFGRGGEEMLDLIAAGISVEIVPGITSGIAVPAYAGIPLTHRDYSSSVTFVTGHEMAGKYRPQVNWSAIAHGSPETPIALIRWGTTPQQQQLIGTFTTIMDQIEATGFESPAIAVIGAVVNLHDLLQAGQPLLSRTIPPTPISP